MLTLMLASFPKLVKLLCFCKCFFLGGAVGFGFNLTLFWGCLSFILCVFYYFIESFEPFRMMRLAKLFAYSLIKLLKIQWMSYMVPSPLITTLVFVLHSKRSFK